jgi:hypothetical protein
MYSMSLFGQTAQNLTATHASVSELTEKIQGSAERTPGFRRGIASGGEHVNRWGARRTAVYTRFSVHHGVVGRTSSLYC